MDVGYCYKDILRIKVVLEYLMIDKLETIAEQDTLGGIAMPKVLEHSEEHSQTRWRRL